MNGSEIGKGKNGYTWEEKEALNGHLFFTKGWFYLDGALATKSLLFKAPSASCRISVRALINVEAEFLIEIFASPGVTSLGTPIPPLNADRGSSNTTALEVYADPSLISDGTLEYPIRVGSGKSFTGVSPGLNHNIVLAPDTIYHIKVTKEAASEHYVDYHFWWIDC
jgi:hypothetical protein